MKCYFKVSDAFEMERLHSTLLNNDHSKYINELHYKYFTINIKCKDAKSNIKKELYLTYNGILNW